MKFIDEATITVRSGDGGRGCVSFRREKYIPRGGPDGGDGGQGGDVKLISTSRRRTLAAFQFKREFKAPNGSPGQGKRKTGKSGRDLTIEVPPGTVVSDADTHQLIKDFMRPGEVFIVARGGRGGQGNYHFKSSTRRAPRFSQPGESGCLRRLKLELKLLADVGLIGLPNCGKSTLISALSSAAPKTGDYPFTTLTPHLGVVKSASAEPFVLADIPGLIAGAHQGAGLGTRFLRHIERTRLLVHLIDAAAIDPAHPLEAYETVTNELTLYNPLLAEKPCLLVLNKLDLPGAPQAAEIFKSAVKGRKVLLVSALTGRGLDRLTSQILKLLNRCHA